MIVIYEFGNIDFLERYFFFFSNFDLFVFEFIYFDRVKGGDAWLQLLKMLFDGVIVFTYFDSGVNFTKF